MNRTILFTVLGYLSGSVLYANVFASLFGKRDAYKNSADGNPGTVNAYRYGGFGCGTLTLVFDVMKAFLPVFLFFRGRPPENMDWGASLVIAAPVLGHIFSVFSGFHGGKGIAATFGALLGLLPEGMPLFFLAVWFIFFSVGLRVNPRYYRTFAAYIATVLCLGAAHAGPCVFLGFLLIAAGVCFRLCGSHEEKEKLEVKWIWKR